MAGDLQKIFHALETGHCGEFGSDLFERDLLDGVDFDVARIHPVTMPHPDARLNPDADAAGNVTSADRVPKIPGEQHSAV
jgi:hypothetical protein